MAKPQVFSMQDIRDVALQYRMDLEKMRFFIGEDRKEAKCFGIYEDEQGYFIVYKNKSDGSRAVRYKGRSEAEASRILFEKLDEEIRTRMKRRDWWEHQERMANDREYAYEYEKEIARRYQKELKEPKKRKITKDSSSIESIVGAAALYALGGMVAFNLINGAVHPSPSTGYYVDPLNNTNYVYYHDNWYSYNNGWYETYVDDYDDFEFMGTHYSNQTWTTDFDDSDYFGYSWDSYYTPASHDDDDYDSIWSWDWDFNHDDDDSGWDYDWSDWDYGDTDWDSDW